MNRKKNGFARYLGLMMILPLALFITPDFARADISKVTQPEGSGSKTSPHGSMDKGYGKSEGSGSKHGKGYSHGSKHGYSKREGSGGKHGYSRHGYSRHGYRGHGGHYRRHGGHGGHGKDPFRHILRFAHALGLKADQVKQIRDKQFEFRKLCIELKAQHQIAHLELDKLVHSGNLDESAIRAVGDKLKQIKSKKIDGMIDAKINLLKLLTDEQRKKIATLHAHRGGRGHGYKGHHK
ncbi:MAG: hypothetical protein GWM98_05360 [Nitrospinaceae bacterium]|nr:Spy/CpxP family protein refolding chaperone [Nitrospinaceae bacterium]NIR53998.1 Spy/CpxP family protein refolding chaperone [Nitrospinaceae bacterium]NIS84417.1 Spy/CpxP family protein refolding chaperone [Nitrospinaceae bacterium]NIT81208.1 Spy/CpxP family protein refolding chaperone [Nitrospinaceae bacterium]NIU43497.1 Spy/CpxP family protein refolding chaperone [Nitrospinaceae bacterium]